MEANFSDNLLPVIRSVLQVLFFLASYSEARMDIWRKNGLYSRQMAAVQELKRLMADCPNARLFDFSGDTEITGNLDNYHDLDHYGPWVNSWMLKRMWEACR